VYVCEGERFCAEVSLALQICCGLEDLNGESI
jgi:hypothetical protein